MHRSDKTHIRLHPNFSNKHVDWFELREGEEMPKWPQHKEKGKGSCTRFVQAARTRVLNFDTDKTPPQSRHSGGKGKPAQGGADGAASSSGENPDGSKKPELVN